MKPSIKAALISALVFPGLGHFVLERRARGCWFLLPSVLAILLLIRVAAARANAILMQIESGTLAIGAQSISAQLAAPAAQDTMVTIAIAVGALCWAGSIIDAFLIKE
jgi:hypothetical protein